jgi:hypothetical protein
MRTILIGASIISTLWIGTVPASAQYLFDRRIDPSNCSWREICDYGGRAYRAVHRVGYYHRRPACPEIIEQRPAPDGTMVAVRTRRCGTVLRAKG